MPSESTASKLLSQRQYAVLRGVSQQAVSKAVKSGRIPTTVDGRIDPVAADAAWANRTRTRIDDDDRQSTAPSPDPSNGHDQMALDRPNLTYKIARASREVSRAKREKIELELVEGKLVSVEEIRTQAFEAARGIRDQLLALPARLAPVVFAAPDVAECHRLLEEAMREVCADFSPGAIGAPRSAKKRRSRASQ